MILTKMMTTKEYVNLCIANKQENENVGRINESKIAIQEAAIANFNNDLYAKHISGADRSTKFVKFSESVKKSLLTECLSRLYEGAANYTLKSVDSSAIGKSLVTKFIEENGTEPLLRSFKTKTLLLSEYNRIVTKYHKLVLEAVDKENPDSFIIDTTVKDNFFDELDMTEPDDVIINIRTRVADAVQSFIDSNVADKLDMKDIIQAVQDKVATAKIDEVKESYSAQGKRAINDLRSKPKNVFGAMVSNMVETVMKDTALKAHYSTTANKLDIDRIVENCELMYTLLETVNTAKIVNVDEAYISLVLTSLKA